MKARYQGTRNSGAIASAPGTEATADPPRLSDAEFLDAFEACTLPEAYFDHAAHVRAGYLYLRRLPFPQATAAMCAAAIKPGRHRNAAASAGRRRCAGR